MVVGVEMAQAEAERRVRDLYDNTEVAAPKNATLRGEALRVWIGKRRLEESPWMVETT
jgi:hypothetical protein